MIGYISSESRGSTIWTAENGLRLQNVIISTIASTKN